MRRKAVVIGGGIGGLATALTLSQQYEVTIIERNSHLGGKIQAMELEGFHFDFGINTLSMPHYFWRVLEPFGNAKELLPFEKIDCSSHHCQDGQSVIFSTDVAYMKEQIGEICPLCATNYEAFLEEIKRLFLLCEKYFLNKAIFSYKDYINPAFLKSLLSMHPLKTLEQFVRFYFPNKFVSQLFLRFATHIGSSPYATPALFALNAYFELVEGTYFLKGGATKVTQVFQELLLQQNVTIRFNETVTAIEKNERAITKCITDEGTYEADVFICNGDWHVFNELLGRKVKKTELSTSAYIELIGLKEGVPMYQHNVLFSNDYKEEYQTLRAGEYAENATIYACYPYANDYSNKPSLLVCINAPANPDVEIDVPREQVSNALELWGIREDQIAVREVVTPDYIASSFLTKGGAIYGQAFHSFKGCFFRPRNRDSTYCNLYYVGGTVHPGGSSPIVVNCGYQVAQRILSQ